MEVSGGKDENFMWGSSGYRGWLGGTLGYCLNDRISPIMSA